MSIRLRNQELANYEEIENLQNKSCHAKVSGFTVFTWLMITPNIIFRSGMRVKKKAIPVSSKAELSKIRISRNKLEK